MVDNLIKGIIFGILAYIWFYAGTMVPWVADGSYTVAAVMGPNYVVPDFGYWFFSILAFVMARGK